MTTQRDLSELDRQIDNAEAHALDPNAPGRKWDQSTWTAPCGTYGCIAGNTVLDAGYIAHPQPSMIGRVVVDQTGKEWFVPDAARQILGLTEEETAWLFRAHNSIEDLRIMQKNLHNGDPISKGL